MYDAVDDPYTYENSTVLINKLGLTSQNALDEFEAEITAARASEPLPGGSLDFPHYCAIHHHLFQDVFEWAGRPRTVRISKQGNAFCYPEYIDAEATKLFSSLKLRNYFSNLTPDDFAEAAAHFLAELNAIHVFREGNGRAQLTFFALLASSAGYDVTFDELNPSEMLDAMIASFAGDETRLAKVIVQLLPRG